MLNIEKLINIENKKMKYRLLFILNVFISIGFTLVGSISILSLLIYLYEFYNISFWECLILDLILPLIYSSVVNLFMKTLEENKENILLELCQLEEEYDKDLEQARKEIFVGSERSKFQSLSINSQVKLLGYIKESCLEIEKYYDIDKKLNISFNNCDDTVVSDLELLNKDSGYSRVKIRDSINK